MIGKLWNTYEHVVFSYYSRRNRPETPQHAEIDPFAVYWIAPDDVTAATGGSFDFLRDTGRVTDGSWDIDHGPELPESNLYTWFNRRFHDGCRWEDTDKYADRMAKIETGRSKRYGTAAEFEAKLRSYETLYAEFEQGNYQLQSELATDGSRTALGDGGRALFPSLTDHTLMRHEIAVNIGRDGTFLWNDGRHRLFLALVAGLDRIPVRVVVRHTEWQELRNDVAKTIETAIAMDLPREDIRGHVHETLEDDLEDVFCGITHPDLESIFENRGVEVES
ncbi:hypothetical protein ACYJ1Y_07150 [Natrialbaceae archaeon A-gly3]